MDASQPVSASNSSASSSSSTTTTTHIAAPSCGHGPKPELGGRLTPLRILQVWYGPDATLGHISHPAALAIENIPLPKCRPAHSRVPEKEKSEKSAAPAGVHGVCIPRTPPELPLHKCGSPHHNH
jgi:hypothetical protein